MRRRVAVVALLVSLVLGGMFAYRAQAQQAGQPTASRVEQNIARRMILAEAQAPPAAPPVQPAGPVHVVTFVDITPLNRDPGTALCKQYAADTRNDPGVTSVQVLAQTNRPNHLVIYEVWQNEAAFNRHEALPHTKDFRAKMLPIIGSPFDQRPHYVVP